MEQETVANPEPVAETVTQAPEAEQPTDDNATLETEAPESEQPEEGQAPIEDDFEDMEWEGKAFKAPKGLKDGILRQSDYTKKTMELANERKEWAAHQAATQSFTKDVGKIYNMDEQIQQYEQVDWHAWHASNPQAAEQARFNLQVLRDQRDQLARSVQSRAQEQEAKAEQEYANRISQDLSSLSKPDPAVGWDGKFTPEVKSKLENVARSLGYSDERLARADATDVKALHLMALGKEYLKQQRAVAKQPITEAQPVPKVDRGRGNVSGDPANMDMERYAQWRKAGGGGGARR